MIIALYPPQKEEEVAPPAEALAEPEVIEKGKKEKSEESDFGSGNRILPFVG